MPFLVVDANIGLDVDISVRCNGEYFYKIVDPLLFYANVCGNVEDAYERSEIDSQLKAELLTALQPAFARISEMGIRYSAVPAHTREVAQALNEELSADWRERRGIEVASFGVNSITASAEDEQLIKDLQRTAVMRNPGMAAASLVTAQGEAMKAAAGNAGGAAIMRLDVACEICRSFSSMAFLRANSDDRAARLPLTRLRPETSCARCAQPPESLPKARARRVSRGTSRPRASAHIVLK